MQKEDVARIVREVAYDLAREGSTPPWDGYTVDPMAVLNALRARRPDVVRHISRHYPGDPYQQLKVWVPRALG